MKKTIKTLFDVGAQVFVLVDVKGTPRHLTARRRVSTGEITQLLIEYRSRDTRIHNNTERLNIRYSVSFSDDELITFWEEDSAEDMDIFATQEEAEKARDEQNKRIEEEREQEKKDNAEYVQADLRRKFKALQDEAFKCGVTLE